MTPGLALFILVTVINLLALLGDWWLHAAGYRTVTEWVWRYPVAGLPILLWQVLGLVGLVEHFYYPHGWE